VKSGDGEEVTCLVQPPSASRDSVREFDLLGLLIFRHFVSDCMSDRVDDFNLYIECTLLENCARISSLASASRHSGLHSHQEPPLSSFDLSLVNA